VSLARSAWPRFALGLALACACARDPSGPPARDAQGGTSPPSGGSGILAGGSPATRGATGGDGATGSGGGQTSGGGGAGGQALPPDSGIDASAPPDASTDAGAPEPPQDLPEALRALGVVALYPRPGSVERCPDPVLRIVLEAPPALGSSGRVRVFDAASPTVPVAQLDMAGGSTTVTRGGVTFTAERAAYVEGHEAAFYLAPVLLERGRTYSVQVESGALRNAAGAPVTIEAAATWSFSTAADPPAGTSPLTVRSDGSGHFCTPQSAIDAAGPGDRTIDIGPGAYHGIVYFRDKAKLTLRGAGRDVTLLAGTNNESQNGGTAKRALVGVDASADITFERLTIHNRTPQGGSQAEALRMQGCDRCIVRDASMLSLQDTLLWSGRLYARDCYIAGNVDFIWGTGTAYFEGCEIKTVGRKGYTVQARNGAGAYGYVFVDSRMTSDPGITGHWLGRIDASVYPASHVAYIDCELGPHIDPAGWQVTGAGGGSLRFWEFGSRSPSGAPVDVSQRHGRSRQLSSAEAAAMRDPATVLDGWAPR